MMPGRLILSVVLIAASAQAAAQEVARQLPVKLRADRIEIDQRSGMSRYLGSVVLTQGTVRLTADRAEARAIDQSLEQVIAHGQPLTFSEKLQDGSGVVEGEARHAEYDAVARQVHLSDQVELRTGKDLLRAGRLRYDIDLETAHAEQADGQRVRAALEPRRRDGDELLP